MAKMNKGLFFYHCFLLFCKLQSANTSSAIVQRILLKENETPGIVVAELANYLDENLPNSNKNFKLLSQKLSSGLDCENQSSWFSLNRRFGTLILSSPIDREKLCTGINACVIEVKVFAKSSSLLIQLNVEVVDVNEYAPVFLYNSIHVDISEATKSGSAISLDQYLATDKDAGNNSAISYSLNANTYFDISQYTDETKTQHLQLVVIRKLDYEEKQLFHLTLYASDNGFPRQTNRIPLEVAVTDENDNVPFFEMAEYHVRVKENSKSGTTIAHVQASDLDTGRFGKTFYSITGSNEETGKLLFHINSTTGKVILSGSLDRENIERFVLFIEARDGGVPAQVGSTRLVVHVEDVNDNAPVLTISFIASSQGNTVYLSETLTLNSYVAYVSAKDNDLKINRNVSLSLRMLSFADIAGQRSEVDSKVLVLDDSGFIRLNRRLDAEKRSRFIILLNASDKGEIPLWSCQEINVVVLDENDNPPQFEKKLYEVWLSEDYPTGDDVVQVEASDLDGRNPFAVQMDQDNNVVASTNGNISYSITGGKGIFEIGPRSGVVSLVGPLDREQIALWKIVVTAIDDGYPTSRKASCQLIITVFDTNDNAPLFTNPSNDEATYYAFVKQDDIITRIQAVDYDVGRNAKIHFTLLLVDGVKQKAEVNRSLFILDSVSGDLRLNMSEPTLTSSLGVHVIVVEAQDQGIPSMKSTKKLTIAITDAMKSAEKKVIQDTNTVNLSLITMIAISAAGMLFVLLTTIGVVYCFKRKTQMCKQEKKHHPLNKKLSYDAAQRLHESSNLSTKRRYWSEATKKLMLSQNISTYQFNECGNGCNAVLQCTKDFIEKENVGSNKEVPQCFSNKSKILTCLDLKSLNHEKPEQESGQRESNQDLHEFRPTSQRLDSSKTLSSRTGACVISPIVDLRTLTFDQESKQLVNLDIIPEHGITKKFCSDSTAAIDHQRHCPLDMSSVYFSPLSYEEQCYPPKLDFVPLVSNTDTITTGYVTEPEVV